MADFQEQAMGLTGLTIDAGSTTPSRAEFSTFLNDGVIDVTSKWLVGHPQDRDDFIRTSAEQTSNGLDLNGADIVSTVRESGTNNDWRPCRKISPSLQSQVVDTDSLSFASKYNPVYMVDENGGINVFPAPGSDPDAFKIYYVNNSPEETDGTALDHASTGIKYFPNDKVYLVVLYASIKSIHSNMTAIIADLASFSVIAVPPVVPAQGTSITAYEAPGTTVATGTIDGEIALMQDYIENNEDVELANAKRSELEMRFKRNLDVFNSNIAKYQTEYQGETGYYNAEVQAYAAEVNAEVTEQAQKVQTEAAKYQWLQDRSAALQAEYAAAFGTPQPAGAPGR